MDLQVSTVEDGGASPARLFHHEGPGRDHVILREDNLALSYFGRVVVLAVPFAVLNDLDLL